MRDEWNKEVILVLAHVCREIARVVGSPASFTLDQSKAALDIIAPKFRLKARLEHFADNPKSALKHEGSLTPAGIRRAQDKRSAAVKLVAKVWEHQRDQHPDLWSYNRWYAQKMESVNFRELSSDDYAERMRRKRNARTNLEKEEAAETPEEEVDQDGEITVADWPE